MLNVTFDEKLGIVRIISAGFSSDDEVESFIRQSEPLRMLARARRGQVLCLVDATETPVQSQTAMSRLATSSAKAYQPGDRTAVVLQSALATMQAKRLSPQDALAMFASEQEALAWLLGEESRALAS